jgi:hypothetical protein
MYLHFLFYNNFTVYYVEPSKHPELGVCGQLRTACKEGYQRRGLSHILSPNRRVIRNDPNPNKLATIDPAVLVLSMKR